MDLPKGLGTLYGAVAMAGDGYIDSSELARVQELAQTFTPGKETIVVDAMNDYERADQMEKMDMVAEAIELLDANLDASKRQEIFDGIISVAEFAHGISDTERMLAMVIADGLGVDLPF